MPLPNKPLNSIFPVVKVCKNINPNVYSFIGTGFFINDSGKFITAKHVFDMNPLQNGETYQIARLEDSEVNSYEVNNVVFDPDMDLASAETVGVNNIECLEIASENHAMNRDIVTVEFSGTRPILLDNQMRALQFRPYFRKGTAIAMYNEKSLEESLEEVMELSFPALKGASGAPVIVEQSGKVVGVIVANIERELLPAQILQVKNDAGELVEETKYFMPNGKAISWRHVRKFLGLDRLIK